MDPKIDTVVVIDAWWNMPDIIAQRILGVECDEIFCNNSTGGRSIHETLKHLEIRNDLELFIKSCRDFKRAHDRSKNVLLVGQAWDCGIHSQLGVDNLVRFIGILHLFVHPDLMAIGCSHIDRTCRDHHIENSKHRWIPKENRFYQCLGHR